MHDTGVGRGWEILTWESVAGAYGNTGWATFFLDRCCGVVAGSPEGPRDESALDAREVVILVGETAETDKVIMLGLIRGIGVREGLVEKMVED